MPEQFDPITFRNDLVNARLIVPSDVKGVYARSHTLEDVISRFDDLVMRNAKDDGAEEVTFPPVVSRKLIERMGYLDNFPQLIGSIHSFFGTELQSKDMAQAAREGVRWESALDITDLMLLPAACYPVYPMFSGLLPDAGRLITTKNWCFRHEPSDEPTRLQSFRMREFIRLGAPDAVEAWRDQWLQRGLDLLQGLGLPAAADVANDPFFGRGGRVMANSQREQRLKFEILVPVISLAAPTAVCSFNWHQEHFSRKFGIEHGSDGQPAHTACLGFGLERVALALLKTHGLDPATWPATVRAQLWV
jgi:seryl-tRNA synthetase